MKHSKGNVQELNDAITAIVRAYMVLDTQTATSPTQALTRQELHVIERIGRQGPAIMRELADYLGVAVNTTTTVVNNLEAKQIVCRGRSEENRRKVWVSLTNRGQKVYDAHLSEQFRTAELLLSSLNADEQQIYLVLMRKIGRVATTLTGTGPEPSE